MPSVRRHRHHAPRPPAASPARPALRLPLCLALCLAGVLGLAISGCRDTRSSAHAAARPATSPAAAPAPAPRQPAAEAPRRADGPLVALIVDDWGQALTGPQAVILALPQPLTLAVLPCLPHSAGIAALATGLDLPAAGVGADNAPGGRAPSPATARREIFLHLPMLPLDYPQSKPGEPVLTPGLDPGEVDRRLATALASVPGARGVNNHMGSAATADPELMTALMEALARRHLLFVDSLTSPASVAYAQARLAGVPALRSRIFLDADRTSEAAIAENLAILVASARARGEAVGIAHPYVTTAEVLARDLPRYEAEGVRFVTVSELMARLPGVGDAGGEAADGR